MQSRRVLFYVVLLLFWLGCTEVLCYFAGGLLQSRWLMYRDPQVPHANTADGLSYEQYRAERDPVLGWPLLSERGTSSFEANGAVPSPANAELDQDRPTVSLYGDSFTFARNVGADNGWDVRLSQRLGRRIDNFGVSGYGSDQAYMRFLRNVDDAAPVVILGHMSENISRNLTRYRDFQNGERWYAFKPKFVIGAGGALERLPVLDLDPDEYQRFLALAEPQLVAEHEYFHPGGPAGAVRLEFPYSLALLRNFHYWRLQSALRSAAAGVREPAYKAFYAPDHPFQGLEVTYGVLASFSRDARSRGQRPLVLLFPSQESTEYYRATRSWSYAPLIDRLRETDVDFINFGEALVRQLGDRPIEEAYVGHHFTAEFHDLVAEVVYQHLARNAWPPLDR